MLEPASVQAWSLSWAEYGTRADHQQRPLHSRCWRRLSTGVRHQWSPRGRLPMTIINVLLCLLMSSANLAFAPEPSLEPNQPPPESGALQILLSDLPKSVALGQYQLTVRKPEDREDNYLGGSGGPVLDLIVAGPSFTVPQVTAIQVIWLSAKDLGANPPEFSLCSKTGVSRPVRCRLKAKT